MIIYLSKDLDKGDITEVNYNPIERKDITPVQPVLILRKATRMEYMQYWQTPGRLVHAPANKHYYEISTD